MPADLRGSKAIDRSIPKRGQVCWWENGEVWLRSSVYTVSSGSGTTLCSIMDVGMNLNLLLSQKFFQVELRIFSLGIKNRGD
jgi:hypothetical protein